MMFNCFDSSSWDNELCRSLPLVYSMETCFQLGNLPTLGTKWEADFACAILRRVLRRWVRPKSRMDVDFWVAREVGFFKSGPAKAKF